MAIMYRALGQTQEASRGMGDISALVRGQR